MADSTNDEIIQKFNEESKKQGETIQEPVDESVANASGNYGPYPPVTPTYRMSVADIQLLNADPSTLSNDQLLRREALATKENLRIAEEEKRKEQKEAKAAAIRTRNVQKIAATQAAGLADSIGSRTAPAGNWLASRPTPGGIATLLIIICIFLLAIVPVRAGGPTRLKLIWLTLSGKTHIDYSGNPNYSSSSNGSSNNQQSFSVPQSPVPTPQTGSSSNTGSIPNYNPAYGNVVSGMFGTTEV